MFLKRLANLPKLSGLHDAANIFEVEAEDIAREAASLLQHDNSPLAGITDQMHPHPVAPAAAPGQTSFVPVVPISQPDRIRGSKRNADSCFYFPECKSSVCGGQREGPQTCEFVKSGKLKIPSLDAFIEAKKVFKDKQQRGQLGLEYVVERSGTGRTP